MSRRPRPLGQIIGRQPEIVYITPSSISPWIGTIRQGDRLTVNQRVGLSVREIDQSKVEIVTVLRPATTREMYWGPGQPAPLYAFDCPVLHKRADGAAKVISPIGDPKYVYPDSGGRWWISRQSASKEWAA